MILVWLVSGCAMTKLRDARHEFYGGHPEKAAEILNELKEIPKRDRLLFLMEKGVVLHRLGLYKESINTLLQASLLMAEQEVISISQQAGSLVTTEWITEYKGEYSERLWIHTYLMMDYLLVNKFEDALVEAKQALKLLGEHPDPLESDYFTRALIALCFDILDEHNGAYIEYKKLAELLDDEELLAKDLHSLARKLGLDDDAEEFRKVMMKKPDRLPSGGQPGEAVFFLELGKAPVKIPGNIVLPPSIRFSFPRYDRSSDNGVSVKVSTDAGIAPPITIATDVGEVARASLKARAAKIMAKETARVAAKEALARSVEESSGELAGAVTRIFLFITEEPDTRSWHTLPKSLVLVRLPLAPGEHTIDLEVSGGGIGVESILIPEIYIKPGTRVFRAIRR